MNKIKTENLILYFLHNIRSKDLGKTKLYKLIFFTDSLAYSLSGTTLTGDKYLKFPMGPVPSSVSGLLHDMKESGLIDIEVILKQGYFMTMYKPSHPSNMDVFSHKELGVMEEILNTKAKLSRQKLVDLSHKKESWINAKDYDEMDFSNDPQNLKDPSPKNFVRDYGKDISILSRE